MFYPVSQAAVLSQHAGLESPIMRGVGMGGGADKDGNEWMLRAAETIRRYKGTGAIKGKQDRSSNSSNYSFM